MSFSSFRKVRLIVLATWTLVFPFSVHASAQAHPDSHPLDECSRLLTDRLEIYLSELDRTVTNPKHGVFGPESMVWKINRENSVFLGSGRAALLQLAHPYVAYAIEHHSKTKSNPGERFQRTFMYIGAIVFGDLHSVKRAARALNKIHSRIQGVIPVDAGPFGAGSPYAANVPEPMFWVFATLWDTSVLTYEQVIGPLTESEKNQYYEEGKRFARLFGIPDSIMPQDWSAFRSYMDQMLSSDILTVTPAARDIAQVLFRLPVHLPGVERSFGLSEIPGIGNLLRANSSITASMLPEKLAKDFGLESPSNGAVKSFARAYRLLPKKIRYTPAYNSALARIDGKTGRDYIVEMMNSLMIGRPKNPIEKR